MEVPRDSLEGLKDVPVRSVLHFHVDRGPRRQCLPSLGSPSDGPEIDYPGVWGGDTRPPEAGPSFSSNLVKGDGTIASGHAHESVSFSFTPNKYPFRGVCPWYIGRSVGSVAISMHGRTFCLDRGDLGAHYLVRRCRGLRLPHDSNDPKSP